MIIEENSPFNSQANLLLQHNQLHPAKATTLASSRRVSNAAILDQPTSTQRAHSPSPEIDSRKKTQHKRVKSDVLEQAKR
jgi:hypothetical protein